MESKNGKRTERGGAGGAGGAGGGSGGAGGPRHSLLTWLVVVGLLGVWSSFAVLYFDIVDYDSVVGELAPPNSPAHWLMLS